MAKIIFVFLLMTVFFQRAHANDEVTRASGFDFSSTLLARSYSAALSLNPTVGYSRKIWGDESTPWYGFVRPNIVGVVSPSLYEGKVGFEIFPVSIFGLDVKRTWSRRFNTIKGQDCDQVQCLGRLDYTDVSLQSYLGVGDYYSSIRWTRTFFDAADDRSRRVYEMGAAVLLNPEGDNADYVTVIVGRNLDEETSVGILLQTADFHSSGHRQEGQYVIVRSKLERWGLKDFEGTVGLGHFKSDLSVSGFSGVLSITYTQTRALGYGR